MPRTETAASARFWAKVQKTDGCWLWTAAKTNGYGVIGKGGRGGGTARATHVSWEIAGNGAVPAGTFLCHKCDTPACVRPDHLFLGTAGDNHTDMRTKQRDCPPPPSAGSDNPNSKLTEEQAREIKAAFVTHFEQRKLAGFKNAAIGFRDALALRFDVTVHCIKLVQCGVNWRHLHV